VAKLRNSVVRWNATDGIVNYCNGIFSRKCDAAPEDIIGKHIDQLNEDNGIQLTHLNNLTLVPGEPQTNTLLWKSKDGREHTELTTVQGISKDGQTITEIQLNGLEDEQEQKFRVALDSLLDIFSDNDSISSDKTQRMLDIGLEYFSMQSGVVGSTMGNALELICVSGKLAQSNKPTDKIALDGSVYLDVLDTDKVVALHNIPQSKLANVCNAADDDLHSFIGTQVLTSNGPLGVISFFSCETRDLPFTSQDIRLISLIANWIGAIIGNEEQLEFLSLQHDYYQSLFRTVPAMMMLCNSDGLILATSDRLSRRIGIDPASIPGKNCHRFFLEEQKGSIDKALMQGDVNHLPLTLRYDNGDTLDIELNSSIKHIGSMQGVRMIVLADVSERNRAMKEVEEQNKQLALVNHSLNQFAFIASHDLQEPLRKIQQFSGFLKEDLGEIMNDEGRYHLQVVVNSAERMTTLIQDLLDFSSAAKGGLELSELDLNELLGEVLSDLELRIKESDAQISIDNLPALQGDKSLVRQLFTNLISNSIKYRDESRIPSIQVAASQINDTLLITITDNGIGFDQELAARAFEPFNRLHTDKKYNGNGIGLSICATVCDKHDWKLSATSEPGIGSVFSIEINTAL